MFLLEAFLALSTIVLPQSLADPEKLLNVCLNSRHHKEKPGPEGELFSQCSPWKDRSCCTFNTTKNLHEEKLYGFNYDHCGSIKKMSNDCRRHFIQDHCFYQCSPNIGAWVVKVRQKTRKERYYQVPLCQSDCEAWFSACRLDLTCTDNWSRNFVWENGDNKCLSGTTCLSFQAVFHNATNFCQKIWDDSWQVVNDDKACMRLWFSSSGGNPNDNVARIKVHHLKLSAVSGQYPVKSQLYLNIILVLSSVYFSNR